LRYLHGIAEQVILFGFKILSLSHFCWHTLIKYYIRKNCALIYLSSYLSMVHFVYENFAEV